MDLRLSSLFILCFSSCVLSTELFLSPENGKDIENCGREDFPCQTLVHLYDKSNSGDIITFLGEFDAEGSNFSGLELNKNITLRSQTLNPQNSILRCQEGNQFFFQEEVSSTPFHVIIEGLTIHGCGHANANGSVISSLSPLDFKASQSIFSNHIAHRGAVLFASFNSPYINNVTLDNCTLESNRAQIGSTLYVSQGNLNILNTRFAHNLATASGSIFIFNSKLTINKSHFMGQYSQRDASVLISDQSSVKIYESNFENNEATSKGTIYTLVTSLEVSDSLFSNNVANHSGGSFYFSDQTRATIKNSVFKHNKGGFYGGALCSQSTTLSVDRSTFENNDSGRGGSIAALFNADTLIKNSQFNKNTARNGAVLYTHNAKSTDFSNCSFSSNRAQTNGAVIYCRSTVIDLKNITLENNSVASNSTLGKYMDIHCAKETPSDYCDVLGDEDYYRMCYRSAESMPSSRKKAIVLAVIAGVLIVGMIVIIVGIIAYKKKTQKKDTSEDSRGSYKRLNEGSVHEDQGIGKEEDEDLGIEDENLDNKDGK